MAGSSEEYLITIKITEEKEEAIKAFFAHNDWNYIKTRTQRCHANKQSTGPGPSLELETDPGSGPEPEPVYIPPANPSDECRYCLIAPCVTLSTYSWEGDGQAACDENPSIRHKLYTKYWWIIANQGGWNDPRYTAKKRTVGGREWAVSHRRERMPLCVLKKVRGLYPNTNGIPYLGHKWQ